MPRKARSGSVAKILIATERIYSGSFRLQMMRCCRFYKNADETNAGWSISGLQHTMHAITRYTWEHDSMLPYDGTGTMFQQINNDSVLTSCCSLASFPSLSATAACAAAVCCPGFAMVLKRTSASRARARLQILRRLGVEVLAAPLVAVPHARAVED